MFQLGRIEKLHDYFSACSRRREQAVFFYRVAGYSGEVAAFLTQYDQAARTNGVVIEGRIPNPDPKQLDYLAEMMAATSAGRGLSHPEADPLAAPPDRGPAERPW